MPVVQKRYHRVNLDKGGPLLRHRAKRGRGRLAIADMRMLATAPLSGWME